MLGWAVLLASLLVMLARQESIGAGSLDSIHVARPGEVLFVRADRRAELDAMPPATVEALCGSPIEDWPSHGVVGTVKAPRHAGTDLRVEPFALTAMTETAAYFGAGDARARAALIGLLDRWARGKGLLRFDQRDENNFYTINRSLLPLIESWSLLRDDPALDKRRRARIEDWLTKVVRLRGRTPIGHDQDSVSARNNHAYLSASVDMAWGALQGDDARFRKGIAAYRRALGQMRDDGSLPLETERGARALWYQRHAIASLVTIAQMARVQGYDLWDEAASGGRSLHTAIRFLLDAIKDPALVEGYAAANIKPGPSDDFATQDLGFLVERGHTRHYMAWAEIYLRRFPERAEARDLLATLEAADPGFRPMIDEYSGGATSCFFVRPTEEGARQDDGPAKGAAS
jgi:poly(beta-D-mannuronate) lyase